MFILIKADGSPVCSVRTGNQFEYGSRALADMAARALRKQYGPLKIVRLPDA